MRIFPNHYKPVFTFKHHYFVWVKEMFKWNIKPDLDFSSSKLVAYLTNQNIYVTSILSLYKVTFAFHNLGSVCIQNNQPPTETHGKWVGFHQSIISRSHKDLVKSSKRHLANATKWEVTKPSIHLLCQRWASRTGHHHVGGAQGLACEMCSRSVWWWQAPEPWASLQGLEHINFQTPICPSFPKNQDFKSTRSL